MLISKRFETFESHIVKFRIDLKSNLKFNYFVIKCLSSSQSSVLFVPRISNTYYKDCVNFHFFVKLKYLSNLLTNAQYVRHYFSVFSRFFPFFSFDKIKIKSNQEFICLQTIVLNRATLASVQCFVGILTTGF